MANTSDDEDRRRATRESVRDADAANGEPGATDDEQSPQVDEQQVDDAPGAGIERDGEPAEPNEPA